MSNQIDGEVHYFQLQYQTTPSISNAEGLKSKHFIFTLQHYFRNKEGETRDREERN